jgi:hypothetical protein
MHGTTVKKEGKKRKKEHVFSFLAYLECKAYKTLGITYNLQWPLLTELVSGS